MLVLTKNIAVIPWAILMTTQDEKIYLKNTPCYIGNCVFVNCNQHSFLRHGLFWDFYLVNNCIALLFPNFNVFASSPVETMLLWTHCSLGCCISISPEITLCQFSLLWTPIFFMAHGLFPSFEERMTHWNVVWIKIHGT
jgi:hypothetical protein